MKKWGFFLVIFACLVLAVVCITPISPDKIEMQPYDREEGALDNQGHSESIQIDIKKEQIYQGNLLLVNKEYAIQEENIPADIVNLSRNSELTEGYVVLGDDIHLSEDIVVRFSKMIAEGIKDGLNYFAITSGFRSFEEQHILYEQMGSDRALPPGQSEHNLGLALDVGSTQMKMEDAPEGKWIEKNAWKYGFILRYPKDKTEITGIQYEPWHIRYVGLPHSAIMYEKNLVLEEYLDYLKEERDISVNVNGKKYNISYYPVSQGLKIEVPVNHHYEISGNNMDGVIVTVYE